MTTNEESKISHLMELPYGKMDDELLRELRFFLRATIETSAELIKDASKFAFCVELKDNIGSGHYSFFYNLLKLKAFANIILEIPEFQKFTELEDNDWEHIFRTHRTTKKKECELCGGVFELNFFVKDSDHCVSCQENIERTQDYLES